MALVFLLRHHHTDFHEMRRLHQMRQRHSESHRTKRCLVVRKLPLQASFWSDQQCREISPCHCNQAQQIEITGGE
jgi:hypothetical protein